MEATVSTEYANIVKHHDELEAEYLQHGVDILYDHLKLSSCKVTISFDKLLWGFFPAEQNGLTLGMGFKPDDIMIIIRNDSSMSVGDKLLTISHEMVHAQQISSGRLSFDYLGENSIASGQWEGERFNMIRYQRSNPWELEAHTMDKDLRQMLINTIGNYIPN